MVLPPIPIAIGGADQVVVRVIGIACEFGDELAVSIVLPRLDDARAFVVFERHLRMRGYKPEEASLLIVAERDLVAPAIANQR